MRRWLSMSTSVATRCSQPLHLPDHYLPLLCVVRLRREDDQVSFPVEGFDGESISMLTVQIGRNHGLIPALMQFRVQALPCIAGSGGR